jgi:hypothetical protein
MQDNGRLNRAQPQCYACATGGTIRKALHMKTLLSAPVFTVLAFVFLLLSSALAFAADAPWCKTSDLTIKALPGSVGLGTVVVPYAFQNHNTKSCSLGGFPSLSALDNKGKPVKGVQFKRIPDILGVAEQPPIPSRIILGPGEEVWFQVTFSSGAPYFGEVEDRSMCRVVETLRIVPPRNRKPLVDHTRLEVCTPLRYTPVFPPMPD